MAQKKKTTKAKQKTTLAGRAASSVRGVVTSARVRQKKFLARRPHRSFRLTRRRDYKRSFKIPGYWSFTNHVRRTVWKNKKLFGGLMLVYAAVMVVISEFGIQDNYSTLSELLRESGGDIFTGNFGKVAEAGLLLYSTITSSASTNATQAQSVLGGLAFFFAWLATIWLLRNVLAGHNPKLRDGLYNSGAPVLSTVLVGFVMVIQLLPASIGILIYSAAAASGLLETGVSAMLVWMGVALLCLLSLYWITSTFIAMVVVTLPGMYPLRAIRTAGDLVVGRRVRILFRLLWLALIVIAVWVIIMIPLILLDDWIKTLLPAIAWIPFVPYMIILMGSLTIVFVTSYIYLLYRRIVDDDAAPA